MSGDFDEYNSWTEQPGGWNQFLQDRDGEESGAHVKMFVANDSGVRGLIEYSDKHAPYSAIPGHLGKASPAEDIIVDDMRCLTVPTRVPGIAEQRAVSTVARRGKDVSYLQDGTKIAPEIREVFDKMTWQEIKKTLYVDGEADPCGHL
ncbi:hypothetical protein MMC14_006149 [Varicellaria rhodocarpa]|nr:hypothetical protein [Varicellaria rhodocarpa]